MCQILVNVLRGVFLAKQSLARYNMILAVYKFILLIMILINMIFRSKLAQKKKNWYLSSHF